MRSEAIQLINGGKTPEANLVLQPKELIGTFPLSFAQEGLWFVEQMTPGSAAYNMPDAWRLKGPLDVRALEAGVQTIVVEVVRRVAFTVPLVAPLLELPACTASLGV